MIWKIRGRCGLSRTGTVLLKAHLQELISGLLVLTCARPSPRFIEMTQFRRWKSNHINWSR